MLYERMEVLLENYPDNATLINGTAFREVVQEVYIANATPALWFYAAGVSTVYYTSLRLARCVSLAHVNLPSSLREARSSAWRF